ncbi:hypothetical protein, partial [Clostridium sp. HBUAS56017]|uniref:hypothetical protein n=1 Tax=Clostridium sp. HBUAS56017 TaxID=2571128 RepID=UPI00163DA3AC
MIKIIKRTIIISILALLGKCVMDIPVYTYAAEVIPVKGDISQSEYNEEMTNNKEAGGLTTKENVVSTNTFVSSDSGTTTVDSTLSEEEKAIIRINNGTEDLNDYTLLRIRKVKLDNIQVIRKAVADAKIKKKENLNKDEISAIVDDTVAKIDVIFDKINLGQGEESGYSLIQITEVNNKNIADINNWLKDKRYRSISKIKEVVDKILLATSNINNGIETIDDYNTLEIYNVKFDYIELIRKSVTSKKATKGDNLNRAEIIDVTQKVIDKIKVTLDKINQGQATIDDYKFIGINEVNEVNISDINEWVKGKGWTELGNVKVEINTIIEPLRKINDGKETEADYEILGIEGVTKDNISWIREVILGKRAIKQKDLTKSEIASAVDEALKIIDFFYYINSGKATIDNYKYIGATGVNINNIFDVNEALKGKNYRTLKSVQEAIDKVVIPLRNINGGNDSLKDYEALAIGGVTQESINAIRADIKIFRDKKGIDLLRSEIKESVDSTLRLFKAIEAINSGNATIEDYEAIGIDVVTSTNLLVVNRALQGKNYTTIAQIKIAVELVIKNDAIYTRINLGQATLKDYESIGVVGVTAQNLAYININVRGEDYVAKEAVQERVNIVIKIYESIIKANECFRKINEGIATVEDYKYLGIVGLTTENLTYINLDLKGRNYTTSPEIQERVDILVKVYDAYGRISRGEGTLDDYTTIGVIGVTVDNLVYINVNIKGTIYSASKEIQVKVDVLVKMYNAFVRINAGQGTIEDYKVVGIVGITVDNLAYVNINIKGNDYFVAEKLQIKIDVLVKMYNAFVRINAGQGTIEDYKVVGIVGITVDNLVYVNINIKGNTSFVVSELQIKIDVLVKVYNAYARINLGQGTIEDYRIIGAVGVTIDNLVYVNADLKGRSYEAIGDVQARIDIIVNIYESIIRINLGEGTLADYNLLGIVGVNVNNLAYINADLKGKGYITIAEIKTRIEANIKIYDALIRINLGQGTLDDYRIIGATGVTVDNLIFININIKGYGYRILSDVQVKVKDIVAQYEIHLKIAAIIERINLGTASVDDYEFIGITGVNVQNLIYVNVDLKGKNYNNQADIQVRVNLVINIRAAYGRIDLGNASLDDYELIGATGVNINNLIYINAELKGKGYGDLVQVQASINKVVSYVDIFVRINGGEGTLNDYIVLGILGVTKHNIIYINAEIKGKGYLTLGEYRIAVNTVVAVCATFDRINDGQGTLADFQLLGLVEVNIDNLIYINEGLKGKNYRTIPEIKVAVNTVIEIHAALDRINNGQGTLADYNLISVTGVTEINLIYINAELKGKGYSTLAEIQAYINKVTSINEILVRINAGEGNLSDYAYLGITGVTIDNLIYVNADIKGRGYTDLAKIKIDIAVIININNAYIRINNGQGTLDDYNLIGVTGVTVDNLIYINGEMKGNVDIKAKNAQVIVKAALSVEDVIKRINNGQETIE